MVPSWLPLTQSLLRALSSCAHQPVVMPNSPHLVHILSQLLLMGRTWNPFASLPTPLAISPPTVTTRVLAHLAPYKKSKWLQSRIVPWPFVPINIFPVLTIIACMQLPMLLSKHQHDIKFHSQLKLPERIQRKRFSCFVST